MSPTDNTPENQPERKPRKRAAKKAPAAVIPVPAAEVEPVEDPIETLAKVMDRAYITVMRHEPQLRRLARAIEDTGLPLPRNWASFGDDGTVSFAPISAKQFSLLLNALEQIADRLPEPICPSPSAHDEPLFEIVTVEIAAEMNNTSNSATPDSDS